MAIQTSNISEFIGYGRYRHCSLVVIKSRRMRSGFYVKTIGPG